MWRRGLREREKKRYNSIIQGRFLLSVPCLSLYIFSAKEKKAKNNILILNRASTQSPTRWLKDLIGPHRPALQMPKNAVAV